MVLIRKTLAILALAALGGLIVTLERGSYGVNPRLVVFTRVLLVPLGLLLVAVSCVLFVPAGTYFVWKEASYTGEIYLFAAAFLPGVIAGWTCLIAFGKPILHTWRAG